MSGTSLSGRPSTEYQISTLGEQTPPPMPKDLQGEQAQELWRIACEELQHVLRTPDYAILKQCCQAFQLRQDAQAKGDVKLALSCFRLYENHAKQIGLTPSSRRVVRPSPSSIEPEEETPFQKWLKRGGLNG